MLAPVATLPTLFSGQSRPFETCTRIPSVGAFAFQDEILVCGKISYTPPVQQADSRTFAVSDCVGLPCASTIPANGKNVFFVDEQFPELPYHLIATTPWQLVQCKEFQFSRPIHVKELRSVIFCV